MRKKILIPLHGQDVAPRFDLAGEALIVSADENGWNREDRQIVLPRVSAEKLCHLILTEGVQVVICGGIEEEYYQYLVWRHIQVLDSVIGRTEAVLERFFAGLLKAGDIVVEKSGASEND